MVAKNSTRLDATWYECHDSQITPTYFGKHNPKETLTEHYVVKAPTEMYESTFRLHFLGLESLDPEPFGLELMTEGAMAERLRLKAHLELLSQSPNEFVIAFMNPRT